MRVHGNKVFKEVFGAQIATTLIKNLISSQVLYDSSFIFFIHKRYVIHMINIDKSCRLIGERR